MQFEHFQGAHIILKLHYIQDQEDDFIKFTQMDSVTPNFMDLPARSVTYFSTVVRQPARSVANKNEQIFLLNITMYCHDREIRLIHKSYTRFQPSLPASSKRRVQIFASGLVKILELKMQSVAEIKMKMIPTVLVTSYAFCRNGRGLEFLFSVVKRLQKTEENHQFCLLSLPITVLETW